MLIDLHLLSLLMVLNINLVILHEVHILRQQFILLIDWTTFIMIIYHIQHVILVHIVYQLVIFRILKFLFHFLFIIYIFITKIIYSSHLSINLSITLSILFNVSIHLIYPILYSFITYKYINTIQLSTHLHKYTH